MSSRHSRDLVVLAIRLNTRGFAFAVFEGSLSTVDWGIKGITAKGDDAFIKKVRALMQSYRPTVLVLQDCKNKPSRCTPRVEKLVRRIARLPEAKDASVFKYSRADIRACFAAYDARTKDEIARAIAKVLPEFSPKVPPIRKIWMSEDYRMGLFDAISLVFTHHSQENAKLK